MFAEICLAIIAVMLIGLAIILIKISSQFQESIRFLQTDIHRLSTEISGLLSSLTHFIQKDLHGTSTEITHLVQKLTDISSDINEKSHSLNFLFKPLNFMSSKMDPSKNSFVRKCESIPHLMKWIVSSAQLFKSTREFIKR